MVDLKSPSTSLHPPTPYFFSFMLHNGVRNRWDEMNIQCRGYIFSIRKLKLLPHDEKHYWVFSGRLWSSFHFYANIISHMAARKSFNKRRQLISLHTNLGLFSLLFFSLMRSNCQCPLCKSAYSSPYLDFHFQLFICLGKTKHIKILVSTWVLHLNCSDICDTDIGEMTVKYSFHFIARQARQVFSNGKRNWFKRN